MELIEEEGVLDVVAGEAEVLSAVDAVEEKIESLQRQKPHFSDKIRPTLREDSKEI